MNSARFLSRSTLWTSAFPVALSVMGVGGGVSAMAASGISFNRDIRPILAENCMSCHGPDPGSRKAGLRLDTEAGLFEKRKEDPAAVIRGNAGESELYKRLITKDVDEVMPPPDSHKKLKPQEIELLKKWIEVGAPWQPHWSLIAPQKAELPEVKQAGWVKNPIDRFVLSKLERRGLAPAPEAGPRVLFRRMHFDLTGLPPKMEEVEAFVSEYEANADAAVSKAIDRLMQSPAWGEHRGRYWLDAARYADTHGLHFDNYREMWLYRDWVIRAFNANLPFSQFTKEQIAGDLLPNPTEDQLIATGFQRCNITTAEGGTIPEENLAVYASDRVQTMGWVYLGLTMNCAQCHDHKFDPLTMRDYYGMAAFFRNTTQGAMDRNAKDGGGPVLVVPKEEDRARWDALPGLIADTKAKRDGRRVAVEADFQKWLSGVNLEGIAGELPSEKLMVRAALNEGSGADIRVQAGGDVMGKGMGEVGWMAGGKFGAAPVLKAGASIGLGEVGKVASNEAFSFGAWVRLEKGSAKGVILGKWDEKAQGRGYRLEAEDLAVSVSLVDSWPQSAIKTVSAGKVLKPEVWQHVFVTYDGSGKVGGLKIYVDGKEEKTRPAGNAFKGAVEIQTEAPLEVGKRVVGNFAEGVAVQEVRLYGKAVSAAEVKQLAGHAQVAAAVQVEPAKRSGPQKALLLEHYLSAYDEIFQQAELQLAKLESEKETIRERSPLTHIQEEVKGKMPTANIMLRGQYNKLGDVVEALPPAVLHPLPEGAQKNRLGLAQWLVDKNNPLTPRVTVNRFWQEVFGQGIVKTVEDLGLMGAAPSHQDLLDWLAAEFRDNGGDVKALFKLMLSSATYRQAATVTAEKLEKDRDNALLSRGPRFRMDGEMIRDLALAASGLLAPKMYGPSVRPYQPEGIWDVVGLPGGNTRQYVQDKGESLYRRTLYTFWKRMAPPPSMEVFNAPSRDVSCLRRDRTNTPLQALVTLNDVQFVEAARRLAETALQKAGEGEESKALDYIMRQVLGRAPSAKEQEILLRSRQEFAAHYEANPSDASALVAVGEAPLLAKGSAPRLAAWTMVCNQVLNLDEALNK